MYTPIPANSPIFHDQRMRSFRSAAIPAARGTSKPALLGGRSAASPRYFTLAREANAPQGGRRLQHSDRRPLELMRADFVAPLDTREIHRYVGAVCVIRDAEGRHVTWLASLPQGCNVARGNFAGREDQVSKCAGSKQGFGPQFTLEFDCGLF